MNVDPRQQYWQHLAKRQEEIRQLESIPVLAAEPEGRTLDERVERAIDNADWVLRVLPQIRALPE